MYIYFEKLWGPYSATVQYTYKLGQNTKNVELIGTYTPRFMRIKHEDDWSCKSSVYLGYQLHHSINKIEYNQYNYGNLCSLRKPRSID